MESIAKLLEEAQSIGVQHGQQMAGKHDRGLISGLKNAVNWARDVVGGIKDRIESAIDDALGSLDDAIDMSEADIITATMNDLIDEMPDLIAETEIQDAVEGAVVDTIRTEGARKMRWMAEPDACPLCAELASEGPIDVNDEWQGGITNPPLHPHCRCSVAIVLEDA